MRSAKEIRRLNFVDVVARLCDGSQTRAADVLRYSTPSLVSRYASGAKDIGDGTARKVEEAFGLGRNWMDTDHAGTHAEADAAQELKKDPRRATTRTPPADGIGSVEPAITAYDIAGTRPMQGQVPLISWVQAGALAEVIDNFAPGDADIWHACPRRHGPHTFALRVRGVSMEPKFQDGDIIFVDPDVAAEHGRNVVVRFEDSKEATFKQLLIEGDHQYLRALNPDWPGPRLIEIDASATICGVVIGKFVEF
ncbi:LexA family transcriptional regulator [Bordetella sp. LUAb4]|uniref:LexA family protein n=1 Tax=Bordetella sp. LUAb4 TaxID=2843195 RepID=UPI001E3C6CA0|nr:S24 family peptidase [Bordetella sp. LUAb4]